MTDTLLEYFNKITRRDGVLEEYAPDEKPLATFWRQGTPGTYYWRLLVPARKLPGRVNQLRADDMPNDPMVRQEGVAVWQFLGDLGRTKFAAQIQDHGVCSLMELDDSYLVPPPQIPSTSPGITKIKKPWHMTVRDSWMPGGSGYSHQAHKAILPSLDGLIVSTDVLAEQYAPYVQTPIYVCPNSVDPDDWPVIQRQDRRVTVGFAGSTSHFYDLSLIERALGWAAQSADLVNIGGAGRTWPWPHTVLKWTDNLADYRLSLQALDIGLCPLKRSDWHDCKSDIKAMELLMAGALPIVQADSPCFKDWVGIVPSASTPKQWEKTVREVLALDADERHTMWSQAYDWLLEHKTIDKHIHKWREAIR